MLRNEIDDKYKWKLSDIVADGEEWDKLYNEIQIGVKEIANFAGKLDNKADILQCLQLNSSVSQKLEKIYVYSKMKMDEDSAVAKYQALTDKAERILVDYSVSSSFITPEITKLSDEQLNSFIADKDFVNHSCYFESVIR